MKNKTRLKIAIALGLHSIGAMYLRAYLHYVLPPFNVNGDDNIWWVGTTRFLIWTYWFVAILGSLGWGLITSIDWEDNGRKHP